MKTIKNLILGALSISAILVASVSCEKEPVTVGKTTGAIALKVTSESDLATKGMQRTPDASLVEDFSTEDSPLFLTLSTEKNSTDVFDNVQTKGSIVSDSDIKTARPSFKVNMFHGGDEYTNLDGDFDQTVAYDGKKEWNFTKQVNWTEEGDDLEFYAHSDIRDSYSLEGQGFFKYTGQAGERKGADAARTSDFLVAHTETNVNDVDIHFYHALAAIRFFSDSLILTKVAIRNVINEGEFTYNADGSDVDAIFNWAPDAKKTTTYEQTYSTNPDVTSTVNGAKTGKTNSTNYSVSEAFFLVPQSLLDSTVIITFYFKDSENGVVKNISTKKLGTSKWKAGYIYNYTLTKSNSNVQPTITLVVNDEMNEDRTEKSNVAVENLKSNAAYVRAHVIANWYNTAHKAVAPWQASQGGTLTINNTGVWVKGADGFYYCLQPVIGYSQTTNFIDKASIVGAKAPASVYDLRLEMKIIAQGVEYDDLHEAFEATWPGAGSAVIDNLQNL